MRSRLFLWLALWLAIGSSTEARSSVCLKAFAGVAAVSLAVLQGCSTLPFTCEKIHEVRGVEFDLPRTDWVFMGPGVSFTPLAKESIPAWDFEQLKVKMDKYPEGFFEGRLSSIHFVRDLRVLGKEANGFFHPVFPNDLTLTLNGISEFHHEFAHLLWHHHGTSDFEQRWREIVPRSHAYPFILTPLFTERPVGGVTAFDAGFVSKYSETNFFEDFAEVAEMYIDDPDRLHRLGEEFPRIKLKTQLVKEFYDQLGVSRSNSSSK